MNTISTQMVADLRKRLEEEKRRTEEQKTSLAAQDPFANTDRLSDNAAVDMEATQEDNHMRVEAMVEELTQKIAAIDGALVRMDQGTYGTCESCKQPISEDRLSFLPTATLCMSCEQLKAK